MENIISLSRQNCEVCVFALYLEASSESRGMFARCPTELNAGERSNIQECGSRYDVRAKLKAGGLITDLKNKKY